MHIRTRMIAAGTAVVLLTGTAGAAAAAAGGAKSPSPQSSAGQSAGAKPTPPGKSGSEQQWLDQLAASLHVSVTKLQNALIDAKTTMGRLGVGPTDAAVVDAVAHDLGVSTGRARAVINQVFTDGAPTGKGKGSPAPGVSGEQAARVLAAILHVSDARAMQVLNQLDQIDRTTRDGINPSNAQFRALAASLHLTPQGLISALTQWKETLVGVSGPSSK
ncbi:MAG: hypothetical protein ACRDVE_16905 [Actinocrinis sp.]